MQNTLTVSPPDTSTGPSAIICFDQWLGDGYCDDENNNDVCNYDDGDCCDSTNPNPDKYIFCDICFDTETDLCLEELYKDKEVPECEYQFIGDRVCNTDNNLAYCYYDGGDCDLDTDSIKTTSQCGKICIF